MNYYISDSHPEGSEFICPSLNNVWQITFGHNWRCDCREHRLILRDKHLHQCHAIQQPWELLGSWSAGTPSTSLGHRNAYSLGSRSERQAHKLLKQRNRYLLEAISSLTWPESKLRQTQKQWHPAILVFRVAARVQPTLLSRDFCGKRSSSVSKSL